MVFKFLEVKLNLFLLIPITKPKIGRVLLNFHQIGDKGCSSLVIKDILNFVSNCYNNKKRPCGKESTEVRITQNKGKEWENSYKNSRDLQRKGTCKHKETYSKYFDGHRHLSQSEESECM